MDTAVIAANGKNRIFWGTSTELAAITYPWTDGDTWFDSGNANQPYKRLDGNWVPASFGDGAIGNLNVAKLVGDTLSGNFVLAGSLKTGTEGARVENDRDGIRVYNNADILQTDLSSSGSSTFKGQIQTSGMEVNGKLKFNSDSEVSPGTELLLLEGYSSPATQPQVVNYWDKISINGVSDVYGITRDQANGDWVVASLHTDGAQMKVTRHDGTSGNLTSTVGYVSLTAAGGTLPRRGVAIAGGKIWIPRDAVSGSNKGSQVVATDGTVRTVQANASGINYIDFIGEASLTDEITISYTQSGDDYYDTRLCTFNTSTSVKSNMLLIDGNALESMAGLSYGTYDLGYAAFATVALDSSSSTKIQFRNPSTGAIYATETFSSPGAWLAIGYYGGNFWATNDGVTITIHTANKITPQFAYTWYDSDSGGTGVHETALSPWSNTGLARAKWEIVTAPIPAASNNDAPNAARVVARVGAGTAYLQGTLTSVNSLKLSAMSTTTAFSKAADFPASATPGTIRSPSGHIVLPGVGRPTLDGITRPIQIAANADLDTFISAGMYSVWTNGLTNAAAQALHYPTAGRFILEVLGDETYPIQRLTKINDWTTEVYVRKMLVLLGNLVWMSWSTYSPPVAAPTPAIFQASISTSVGMAANTNTITGWTVVESTFASGSYASGVLTVPPGRYSIGSNISFFTQSTRRYFHVIINGSPRGRYEGPVTGYSSGQVFLDGVALASSSTIAVQTYGAAAPTIAGNLVPATFSVRALS